MCHMMRRALQHTLALPLALTFSVPDPFVLTAVVASGGDPCVHDGDYPQEGIQLRLQIEQVLLRAIV